MISCLDHHKPAFEAVVNLLEPLAVGHETEKKAQEEAAAKDAKTKRSKLAHMFSIPSSNVHVAIIMRVNNYRVIYIQTLPTWALPQRLNHALANATSSYGICLDRESTKQ